MNYFPLVYMCEVSPVEVVSQVNLPLAMTPAELSDLDFAIALDP